MKRRNGDFSKLRRPVKRSKITEGIYGSTFLYLKFLLVWALVLLADFILEFRFEYLWPFWLLLRSVYDSFRYQGLAFSIFFVFIAMTSDMICFLFIPVHWLFFAASTYVWVQYVWHTERGICLPTVSLWLLFVYIEASVRLKELKSLPFHLDLCRPFAAHCIGYPVVTLGFGFKSYVSYRLRIRRQKEVAKENEFYTELLQKALPQDRPPTPPGPSLGQDIVTTTTTTSTGAVISNGVGHHNHNHHPINKKSLTSSTATATTTTTTTTTPVDRTVAVVSQGSNSTTTATSVTTSPNKFNLVEYDAKKPQQNGSIDKNELQYFEQPLVAKRVISVNDFDDDEEDYKTSFKSITASLSATTKSQSAGPKWLSVNHQTNATTSPALSAALQPPVTASLATGTPANATTATSNNVNSNCVANQNKDQTATSLVNNNNKKSAKHFVANNAINSHSNNSNKDETILRYESDIKRLKADLQACRQTELESRSQVQVLQASERTLKAEIQQLQEDNENLQTKLHNLVTARQQDKQTVVQLEKKLQEEKKMRTTFENQLQTERKTKKAEEAAAARAVAIAAAARNMECNDNCKGKRREMENDLKQLRRELKLREEQLRQIDREAQSLRQYKDSHGDSEVLMSALSAMQDKNSHLENSLSAETRLKLDLFSALGDTKRQLEISQAVLHQREKEIDELKSKIAEVMACMPAASTFNSLDSNLVNSILYNSKFLSDPSMNSGLDLHSPLGSSNNSSSNNSGLDPNASVYTPKIGHDL